MHALVQAVHPVLVLQEEGPLDMRAAASPSGLPSDLWWSPQQLFCPTQAQRPAITPHQTGAPSLGLRHSAHGRRNSPCPKPGQHDRHRQA